MRDKITGRPRGFGFVVFADPAILDRVLEDKHTIDGRADGYFKILRGKNECGIEHGVIAGLPSNKNMNMIREVTSVSGFEDGLA